VEVDKGNLALEELMEQTLKSMDTLVPEVAAEPLLKESLKAQQMAQVEGVEEAGLHMKQSLETQDLETLHS
jgi:uncharacterized protein YaaN involved in tellurite resistance